MASWNAAYHDDGSRLGSDKGVGMTWPGSMVATEDGYYKWWFESAFEQVADRPEAFFHFCESPQHSCHQMGGYRVVVHVDVFRVLWVARTRWLTAVKCRRKPLCRSCPSCWCCRGSTWCCWGLWPSSSSGKDTCGTGGR